MKIPILLVKPVKAVMLFSLPAIINNQTPVSDKQGMCLAEAIYFEARSEPIVTQLAVAQVVLNRVRDNRWPNSVCRVVRQREWVRHGCQFSYRCDGLPEVITDGQAFLLARKIASVAIKGLWYDVTGGSTHFLSHTKNKPSWARQAVMKVKISRITFYYEPPRYWGMK